MSIETIATRITRATGSNRAVLLAFGLVLVWVACGPLFHFSAAWQLTINTGSSVITFLMVFLIQNSQNRQSRATHLKLNELLRSVEPASNRLINIEIANEDDLERLKQVFKHRAKKVRRNQPSLSESNRVTNQGAG
jgi:low affinity Fe/Cu permease